MVDFSCSCILCCTVCSAALWCCGIRLQLGHICSMTSCTPRILSCKFTVLPTPSQLIFNIECFCGCLRAAILQVHFKVNLINALRVLHPCCSLVLLSAASFFQPCCQLCLRQWYSCWLEQVNTVSWVKLRKINYNWSHYLNWQFESNWRWNPIFFKWK